MALTFIYGDYTLDPKPLFNINKEYIKTPANTGLGTRYNITLQGDLLPFVADGLDQGITGVFDGVKRLREAFDTDYKLLYLGCPGEDPIISGHPKITSLDVDQGGGDNYVQRATYSIALNLPTLVGSGFEAVGVTGELTPYGIINYSDDFSIEFADERVGGSVVIGEDSIDFPSIYSVTHNLSAQGEPFSGIDPAVSAHQFVRSRLGFNSEMAGVSGILNTSGVVCNNFRTVSVNKTEGSCNATETFIINPSGNYREDFELSSTTTLEEPYTAIDINGTIQGYANVTYPDPTVLGDGATTSTPKFQNAITAWSGLHPDGTTPTTVGISGLLYSRANSFYKINLKHPAFLASNSLNPTTLSTTLGYNIVEGVITYAHSYNDRPINCVPEALVEIINITENEPEDIFASITALGRASGPVLQDMGTVGPRTREISIDSFLPIAIGCASTGMYQPSMFTAPTGYDAFVSGYENQLTSTYAGVYITSDNKTWQPKIGRFTYQKAWTVGDC
tara:strand:- start:69 stop:1586 length:1518 start_codon:yes stop_codon:yes gene_type:complete